VPQPMIQSPNISKSLEPARLGRLEDQAEYFSVSLNGSDFSGQAAEGLVFEDVLMRRVALVETRLERLRMLDVKVEASDCSGAVWDRARLRRLTFTECRMVGIQLVETDLQDIEFVRCTLAGGLFIGAACRSISFRECVLREASFESAELAGARFTDCDLTGADLRGARLQGADFRSSTLSRVRVGQRELDGVIIDPSQAVQVVALLGVEVRDVDDEPDP
jgi:uncharacterized protein YjbI with pentapeptide repeats